MAGTTFEEIYDFFMTTIDDFRLRTLYTTSISDFNTYLSAWLIQAIPEFSICDQSLSYSGSVFTETLTQKNINILSLLMKKIWLEKEVDRILGMENFIQDKDFKTHSASQNMTAKQARYNMMKEEVSQKLVEYGLGDNLMWTNMYAGIFFVP